MGFNPRAREGRDALRADGWYLRSVSIHAPARGATKSNCYAAYITEVSIHAPARGATPPICLSCCSAWFQSTRPRGARRKNTRFWGVFQQVSIHAPARGATHNNKQQTITTGVSIHAPARGATLWRFYGVTHSRGFNPRAREGRDFRFLSKNICYICFNPRAREGRDDVIFRPRDGDIVSIHAPARGATAVVRRLLRLFQVSIHAPARGATY